MKRLKKGAGSYRSGQLITCDKSEAGEATYVDPGRFARWDADGMLEEVASGKGKGRTPKTAEVDVATTADAETVMASTEEVDHG